MFSEYPHMQNHYNTYFDIEMYKTNTDTKWVATEKIHGTNYSFLYEPTSDVIPCRRSGTLINDPSFYNHLSVFNKYKDNLPNIFSKLKEQYPTLMQIQLYGELFGGLYDGQTAQYSKKVQKGISYCLINDFLAFDLKITLLDEQTHKKIDKFLDWDIFCNVLSETNIKTIPIIKEGSLKEMLQLKPDFESLVHTLYNLPKLESNQAEGYVIRSIKEQYDERKENRVMFKFKNPKFNEIAHAPSGDKKIKQPNEMSNISSQLLAYVTLNRYENVFAKQLTTATKQDIIEAMVKDVIVDWTDDNKDIELNDEKREKINKILTNMVTNFVSKHHVI